jgi:hypothetical protein
MQTQRKLIAALLAAYPGEPQRKVGERAGLKTTRFNHYVLGNRTMDDDAIIGCASLIGWDVQKTLADHRAEIATTSREKSFWRQLSTAAAVAMLCVVGFPAKASNINHLESFREAEWAPMYIMLLTRSAGGAGLAWCSSCFDAPSNSPGLASDLCDYVPGAPMSPSGLPRSRRFVDSFWLGRLSPPVTLQAA